MGKKSNMPIIKSINRNKSTEERSCNTATIYHLSLGFCFVSLLVFGLPSFFDNNFSQMTDQTLLNYFGRELNSQQTPASDATEQSSSVATPSIRSSASSSLLTNNNNKDDWKLWHEMTSDEQEDAFRRIKPYVEKIGQKYMMAPGRIHKHGQCDIITLKDKTSEGHGLCGPPPTKPCNFFSFGINDDPSFDITLANQWGCRGFAADPTVDHPSKLHPLGKSKYFS
jgi:hypothetical protein